jgi:hypothetical protein
MKTPVSHAEINDQCARALLELVEELRVEKISPQIDQNGYRATNGDCSGMIKAKALKPAGGAIGSSYVLCT